MDFSSGLDEEGSVFTPFHERVLCHLHTPVCEMDLPPDIWDFRLMIFSECYLDIHYILCYY